MVLHQVAFAPARFLLCLVACAALRSAGCSPNDFGGGTAHASGIMGLGGAWTKAAQQMKSAGNSSFVAAAATAAGAQLLKKTFNGLEIRQKVESAIQNFQNPAHGQAMGGAAVGQPFDAVVQDMKDMLTQGEQWVGGFRAGSVAVDKPHAAPDAKWLSTDWQELRGTLSLPSEWSTFAQDLNTRASVLQTEVQNNIAEFQNSLSESLKDSRNMIGETIKRTKSMEIRFLDGAHSWPQPKTGTPQSSVWNTWVAEGGILDRWVQHGAMLSDRIQEQLRSRFEHVKKHVDIVKQAASTQVGRGESKQAARLQEAQISAQNNDNVRRLLGVMQGDEWEHVLSRDGVDVYRKQMEDKNGEGSKFYCIKAVSKINAKATDVYELLKDPGRVSEYNDECAESEELPPLSHDTRLTWAASKKYGPFKARDFITRVHHRKMDDGTLIVMSQSEDVDFTKKGTNFVRTEVLLAGNVMRESPDDPNQTEFVTIAHVNPGGAADTPLGAKLVNHICTQGPINFILKLEKAAGPPAAPSRHHIKEKHYAIN